MGAARRLLRKAVLSPFYKQERFMHYAIRKDCEGHWYISGTLGTKEVVKIYTKTHDELIDKLLDINGITGRA